MDWFANKLLSLQEEYLTEENRAFWALAPDKSCYAQGSGWPALDLAAMQQGLRQRLQGMEEVDPVSYTHLRGVPGRPGGVPLSAVRCF